MQLINTIEINPYDFCDKEYDYPNSSSAEFPEEWNQFWKKCISDGGLERLSSIRKGSYLVDIKTINDDELAVILKNELTDVDLSDFEEQVGPIFGGIALGANNTIYIEPTCCSDIGNIKEWESIFEKAPYEWHQLWIGHPWVYYRKINGTIEFSNYTESGISDFSDVEMLVSIAEPELQTALKMLREEHNELELRIRKALESMGIENPTRISGLMTGNV